MGSAQLLTLATAALMLSAAPARAAEWSAPSTLRAGGIGHGAVAAGPDGSLVVVSQRYTGGGDPASVVARTLRGTTVASRLSSLRSRLVDWVAAPAGGFDLLLTQTGRSADRRGRLVLVRLTATGNWRVSTVSRSVAADAPGAVARRGDGSLAIVWADAPEGGASGARDALVRMRTASPPGTRTRPRIGLGQTRVVRGLMPPALGRPPSPRIVTDIELAFGKGGDRVVALTTSSGVVPALVLASLSGQGRLLEQQIASSFSGYVSLTVAASGRVGVLLEDRGSAIGDQECVSDGRQRIIRVAVRESGARRFSPMQLLDRRSFECLAPEARMVVRPDGHMAVLWGGETTAPPGDVVRLAEVAPGARFGEPSTPWTGERLGDAVFGPAGDLIVSTIRPAGTTRSGELLVRRRAIGGAFGSEERVAPSGVSEVHAVSGSDGLPVLAWPLGPDALAVSRSTPGR